jgi:hypothetical protein
MNKSETMFRGGIGTESRKRIGELEQWPSDSGRLLPGGGDARFQVQWTLWDE